MTGRAARRRRASESRQLRAAFLGLAVIAIATVAVFLKQNPFADTYDVKGVFVSTNQLRAGSDVRIGGLRVGRVTSLDRGPRNTAMVTMAIDDRDVPIREDARLSIEPRLVLEGNDYIKVSPGTPGARELADGATIPAARTSVAVQLDEALDVLEQPARGALRGITRELGDGLGGRADASGARGLRDAARELDATLGSLTRVSHAALGTRPADLRRAARTAGDVTEQLSQDPAALSRLVSSYSRVSTALAARDQALGASVQQAAALMRAAPARLSAIDAALPRVSEIARPLRPVARRAPAALRSTNRLLGQIDAAVRPGELPRLLEALEPVTAHLPLFEQRLTRTAPGVTDIARCLSDTVIPALNQRVPDGVHSVPDPVWLELLHLGASLAASSPNFDGNGTTIRLGVTESEQAVQGFLPGLGRLEGAGVARGMNPEWLGAGRSLPHRPDAPCTSQELPDLGARASTGPDWLTPVDRSRPTRSERGDLRLALRRFLGLVKERRLAHRPSLRPTPPPLRRTRPKADSDAPPKPRAPRLPERPEDTVDSLLDRVAPNLPKPPRPVPDKPLQDGLTPLLDRVLPRGGLG